MILRRASSTQARLATVLALTATLLATVLMMTASPIQAATGTDADAPTRALEVQGLLAGKGEAHFLGLQPADGAASIVVTLVYRTSHEALVRDGVNFTVLTEEGMQAYLLGTPLTEVALAEGAVLRADPDGTIVQAIVRGAEHDTYTVLVANTWHEATNYMLSVHGGVLLDEGGQTLVRVAADPEVAAPSPADEPPAPAGYSAQPPVHAQLHTVRDLQMGVNEAAQDSGRVRGLLRPLRDRQHFALSPVAADGEVTLTLTYDTGSRDILEGAINFWLLTQDGLEHVNQGALLSELYLATGQPVEAGRSGAMTTTIRLGTEDAYALIVSNESGATAEYELEAQGAQLVAMEDGDPVPAGGAAMAVVQP